VLAGSVLLIGPVAPSWAHAEIISSNPADGSTVSSVPASVTLTFTDEIDQQFVRTAVTTPAGSGVVQSTAVRQTVTVPVSSAGPGAYKVLYRVVSADGHPISGQLRFTVAGTPTATPPSTSAATSASSSPAASKESASDSGSGSGAGWMLPVAILLAVVAGGGAVFAATRGRRS
jgi:copper resistance protein C